MKKLNSDGSVSIPSNYPRTRRGPDSRGPRICFAELGRSCSLMQGYLIFTDGSAYVYTAPSNSDVEALCDQFQRGRVFNFFTRRSNSGYVRGFTPPADYETIYSYPPYPGTTPTACPLTFINWNDMVWDTPVLDPGIPARTITASVSGNTFQVDVDGRPSDPHPSDFPSATIGGGFTYTGPGGSCTLNYAQIGDADTIDFFIPNFTQDGIPVDISIPDPSVSGEYLFDILPGVSSVIRFDAVVQGVTGAGPGQSLGMFLPAN